MATITVLKALSLADEFRHGRTTCRPIELWRLADAEADSAANDDTHRILRMQSFRHAMIHAGYLVTAKGGPYKRCSMCHQTLRR